MARPPVQKILILLLVLQICQYLLEVITQLVMKETQMFKKKEKRNLTSLGSWGKGMKTK